MRIRGVLAMLLLIVLSGCGTSSDANPSDQPTAPTSSESPSPTATATPEPTPTPVPQQPPEPVGRIAFHYYASTDRTMTIRVVQGDGSGYTDLPRPDNKRLAVSPVWSSDGSRLAFEATDPWPPGIYISTPELDSSAHVTTHFVSDASGGCQTAPLLAYSPLGHLAIYASEPSGLTIIDPLSGEITPTGDALRGANAPSFSSTGALVFTAWAPDRLYGTFDRDDGCGIFLLDIATENKRYLTPGVQPVISPDGSKVAFTRNGSLFAVNIDGSGEVKLLSNESGDPLSSWVGGCDWSPDSHRLACGAPNPGDGDYLTDDGVTIVVIDVSTGAVIRLGEGVDPTWSPDGNWLAYTVWSGEPNGITKEIYLRPANGFPDVRLIGPGESPQWSPTP